MDNILKIKGWVTPKYLDCDWFSNFTVSLNNKKNGDIPVLLEIESSAFAGAKLTSSIKSYSDLEKKIDRLEEVIRLLKIRYGHGKYSL